MSNFSYALVHVPEDQLKQRRKEEKDESRKERNRQKVYAEITRAQKLQIKFALILFLFHVWYKCDADLKEFSGDNVRHT